MNIVLFLIVACFWGGSFIAIQPMVQIVPPLMAAAIRIGVAIAFVGVVFPFLKVPLRLPADLRKRVWGTGLFAFTIPFALLFWGEKSISPGLAGILNGTVPIFVFILGLVFTPGKEPITFRKVFGLILGIVGVISIFLPKLIAEDHDPSLWGALAVAGMAASYAVSVLLNRVLFTDYPKLHPFTNLFHQLCAGFLVLFMIAVASEGWPQFSTWQPVNTVVWASLYLGVGSTSIAFMLFYRLIRHWGSVRAATVTYVVPAAALLFDFILNGVVPHLGELLGVVAVTVGVIILNLPSRASAAIKNHG